MADGIVPASWWGFTRYVLKKMGPMAGTLMAPRPGAPKVDRFITLGGEPMIMRYNSKLPVVVYVPEGVEVRPAHSLRQSLSILHPLVDVLQGFLQRHVRTLISQ